MEVAAGLVVAVHVDVAPRTVLRRGERGDNAHESQDAESARRASDGAEVLLDLPFQPRKVRLAVRPRVCRALPFQKALDARQGNEARRRCDDERGEGDEREEVVGRPQARAVPPLRSRRGCEQSEQAEEPDEDVGLTLPEPAASR